MLLLCCQVCAACCVAALLPGVHQLGEYNRIRTFCPSVSSPSTSLVCHRYKAEKEFFYSIRNFIENYIRLFLLRLRSVPLRPAHLQNVLQRSSTI